MWDIVSAIKIARADTLLSHYEIPPEVMAQLDRWEKLSERLQYGAVSDAGEAS